MIICGGLDESEEEEEQPVREFERIEKRGMAELMDMKIHRGERRLERS